MKGNIYMEKKIKGKEYVDDILEYEGEYLYDKKWNGKGYDENHNIIYELINGSGKVKEYYHFHHILFHSIFYYINIHLHIPIFHLYFLLKDNVVYSAQEYIAYILFGSLFIFLCFLFIFEAFLFLYCSFKEVIISFSSSGV